MATNLVWFLAVVALCYDIQLMDGEKNQVVSIEMELSMAVEMTRNELFEEGDTE